MTVVAFISFHLIPVCALLPMFLCSVNAVPVEARRGHGIPLNLITSGCEPSWGCWELSLGPWKNSQCSRSLSHLSIP